MSAPKPIVYLGSACVHDKSAIFLQHIQQRDKFAIAKHLVVMNNFQGSFQSSAKSDTTSKLRIISQTPSYDAIPVES